MERIDSERIDSEGIDSEGINSEGLIVRGLNKIVFVLMIVVSVGIVKLFLYKIIKQIKKYKKLNINILKKFPIY